MARMHVILVGIDPDGQLAAVSGGLPGAIAGGSGGGIDDIDTAVELLLRDLGVIDDEMAETLAATLTPVVKNWAGTPTGQIRPAF